MDITWANSVNDRAREAAIRDYEFNLKWDNEWNMHICYGLFIFAMYPIAYMTGNGLILTCCIFVILSMIPPCIMLLGLGISKKLEIAWIICMFVFDLIALSTGLRHNVVLSLFNICILIMAIIIAKYMRKL